MNEQKALELEMRREVIITEALRMTSLKFILEDLKFEEISDNFNNVYLDFNVFQAIEDQNIVLRDDLAFIYSPIHINEVVRMKNDTYERKRIQTFRREANEKTRMSSYHDVDHALYASWAEFFITNDSRLAEKTKYIYDFLGIGTKVF